MRLSEHFTRLDKDVMLEDFKDKSALLLPTLCYCLIFFLCYYLFIVIPQFGVQSTIFLVDNIGGAFIGLGFISAHYLTRYIQCHVLLLLPSFMATCAAMLFLLHREFFEAVNHLWLSAQVIGIIFSVYLGCPKWNFFLLILNVSAPIIIAYNVSYIDVMTIFREQAVVYFAGIITIFLTSAGLINKQKLIRAKKEAKHAEAIKGTFLANMSHELRTPMNGVIGSLQLLQKETLTTSQSQLVENGVVSSQSMLAVINDILDFTKNELGALKLEAIETDIRTLGLSLIEANKSTAEAKGLNLNLSMAQDAHCFWRIDPLRTKQVITNLLSNAIKFTQIGEIVLRIENNENELILSVIDTGKGIPPEALSIVFERFAQADITTTREYGGTGLGLAICKQIVEHMKGVISVTSKVGDGTTFKVRIPAEMVKQELKPLIKNETALPPNLSRKQLLLAEDNMINQKVMTAMLSPTKANVLLAKDGLEAIKLANEHTIDLYLLDIQMPNMNGIDACLAIKRMDPNAIIIAVTANVFDDDLKKYHDAGFCEVIPKPVNIEVLYQTIRECC